MLELIILLISIILIAISGYLFIHSRKKLNLANHLYANNGASKPNSSPIIKFFTLLDYIDFEPIFIPLKNKGTIVFLNLKRFSGNNYDKNNFLTSLNETANTNHITVREIADDIIMLAPSSTTMEIRSLSSKKGQPSTRTAQDPHNHNKTLKDVIDKVLEEESENE
ncbi:MAG: hypothetical protein ACTSYA_12790 [Candidatus Kariarchaeaceae archaeon]